MLVVPGGLLASAAPQLEQWLGGSAGNYLVGDSFTLADLTAASMLAPLFGPHNSPCSDTRLPPISEQLRAEARATVAGQWVLRLYGAYRGGGYYYWVDF